MAKISMCPGLLNVNEALSLFDKFITRVLQLGEMHCSSSKFVLGYQHELEKLRRAPLDESSSVVKDILKSIPSSRVASYQAAGCCHVLSDRQTLVKLNGFFDGLKEHISRAQSIMEELAKLVAEVSILMDVDLESMAAKKLHLLEHDEDPKQVPFSEGSSVASWRTSDYAILMSSILSMLEKDLQMQALVVSDLRLDVAPECLQTYTQMWSLRPFIEEGLLQQALALAHK